MINFFKKDSSTPEKQKDKGVTLIELVISMVVMAVIFLPLLQISGSLLKDTAGTEFSEVAYMLAEEELEKVMAQSLASVVNAGPTSYTGNYADYSYEITVSTVTDLSLVTNCATQSDCKEVAIEIFHTSSATPLATITTLVT